MTIQFGSPVPLDEIELSHVLRHPIWVWVWETGREDEADDETWQCPVMGTTDVTPGFVEPVITVQVKGTDTYGSGSYSCERDQLESISLWENGAWIAVQETSLPAPIVLIAVPTIDGVAGAEFVCDDPSSDRAARAR